MTEQKGPILIVEDITTVRELLEMQLKVRGYEVISAADGQEALGLIEQRQPALIISDILMPRVDGFAFAHKLRLNPQTALIPIIFLSATYVSAEDERFALNLGAMRFLPKAVDGDNLAAAVDDVLKGAVHAQPPMSEREFYVGYRGRLKTKLQQKAQQIQRNQQQLAAVPEAQRETYRRLIAEAQEQHEELQRELDALAKTLEALE